MTRIDFYILGQANDRARHMTACRLSEKAFRQQLPVYIHTESSAEAHTLDDLLWTFRGGSFLPHKILDSAENETEARDPLITIGYGSAPSLHEGVLINLASAVPDFFSRFERVIEVVDADNERRQSGRDRYRFYKDRGYKLGTHKL